MDHWLVSFFSSFTCMNSLRISRLFLSLLAWLSFLDFSWQRYILWFWNLSACLVKNRRSVESWDSLSFSFAHYLKDHFSHAIEKTSLVCLLFLFPLKDWFGFLSIACSLVFYFLHFHHHGVDPFWKVKTFFLSKAFSFSKTLKINCWNYWKRNNREFLFLRDLLHLYFKGNCVL